MHTLLLFFLISLGLFIFLASNPIHAVLFLILAIINSALILFYLNVEFLGLILIIIYVGAVAILFLFIIMMLKVKTIFLISYDKFPIYFFIASFISSQLFLSYNNVYTNSNFMLFNKNLFLFDSLSNLDVLGQTLFFSFSIHFLLAGISLLIAMLIAIVLTLNYSNVKPVEPVYAPLARSSSFLTYSAPNLDYYFVYI